MNHENVLKLTNQELETFAKELDRIATALGEGFAPLAPEEIRRLSKLHAKRASVLGDVTRLAAEYGVESPSAPLARMQEQLGAVGRIKPIVEKVQALDKVLTDLLLSLQAEISAGVTANYGMLRSEARHNPVLAQALEPVKTVLTVPRKKKKDEKPEPAAAKAVASTQA